MCEREVSKIFALHNAYRKIKKAGKFVLLAYILVLFVFSEYSDVFFSTLTDIFQSYFV